MNKFLLGKILIVVAMFLTWIYFYNLLPDNMPIHWNYEGKVDNYWTKNQALFLFPGIALILVIMFYFLPAMDPKKDNYPKFEKTWEIFQFAILWFFAYIYFVSIFITLNPEYNMNNFMMIWLWLLFMILGNYMGKIRQNYFVWIKLPWTLANDEVWNKTHRFWGKTFLWAGLLFFINAFIGFKSPFIFLIIIVLTLLSPIIYSYIIFKKLK